MARFCCRRLHVLFVGLQAFLLLNCGGGGGGTSNPPPPTVKRPPAISSAGSATFTVGTPGSFAVTATGSPTPTLSESGTLPSGVSFNASTGVLSGTPAAGTGGTYSITFTASNGVGVNATQTFALAVNEPPAFTSTNSATFTVGTAESFAVKAAGFPAPALSESGALPSGVTFNAGTGVLGGTPAAGTGGTYSITFTASNAVGVNATQTFALAVSQLPAITSTSSATFTVGTAESFAVTAAGFPTPTLSETGTLPSGVSFNTGTGVLSGTPAGDSGGTYPLIFTASNGVGTSATQSFTLTVNNPEPVLYSVSPNAVTAGDPDTTVTLGGSGFAAPSVAYADATELATVFQGSTQLRATIPSGMLASTGTLTITVVTPGPGGGTSTGVSLRISPSYPRSNATSVLRDPSGPLLPIVPGPGKSTVAVLDWTTREDAYGTQEDLLAVCHTLSPLGIPHVHVMSVPSPSEYPFLAVAGVLDQDSIAGSSNPLLDGERDALSTYVQTGGTLFLWLPSDTGVLSRLNLSILYEHTDPSNTFQRPLTFDLTTQDYALRYIDYDATGTAFEEAEVYWQMLYPGGDIHTFGYSSPGAGQVLATWDADGAAVVRSDLGTGGTTGRAYVFGWRLRHNLTDAEREIAPDDSLGPPWTNTPRLGADICRLLVRGAYEGWAGPNAQIRQFAPGGKKAALIVTHDVDDQTSYDRIPLFAQYESSQSFTATFNLTTSPYDSWVDGFYDAAGMQNAQEALSLGHDIESHSFGHFPDFDNAPYSLTTPPTETAGNYLPQWDSASVPPKATNFSLVGELGVSRWLLENDFGIPKVEAFRSGYLLIAPRFFEGLSKTGYRRDSSYASGVTRGSFPFVAFEAPGGSVTTYPIMEYPMAIEDPPDLSVDNLSQVLDEWEKVIRANYNNNAPTVLNLHPSLPGPRFEALQGILQRVADLHDLWIGDWKTFAQFWEAQGVTCSQWP